MTENLVRIVGAAIDTKKLTLYRDNGETIVIEQGDQRIRKILDHVVPEIKSQGWSVVDLSFRNEYQDVEERTNGLIRFFRVAKKKLSELFSEELTPGVVGNTNVQVEQPPVVDKIALAVEEIMANAKPAHSNDAVPPHETVVAVVDNKVLPDVQYLSAQVTHAVTTNNSEGLENFMKRAATVASERHHSAQDLMRFMERGDLPLANDGSIIVYKVLRRAGTSMATKYPTMTMVDCHTGKVPQGVGVEVRMDPSLVDPNRRNECSNGLHIARRAYIKSFGGDVCVLARIRPEDVIAVPSEDANKMRVCAYEILATLSNTQYEQLRKNKPITELFDGKALLAMAIAGGFPPPHTRVVISGQMGSDISVENLIKLSSDEVLAKNQPPSLVDATEFADALNIENPRKNSPPVAPLEVARQIANEAAKPQATEATEATAPVSQKESTPMTETQTQIAVPTPAPTSAPAPAPAEIKQAAPRAALVGSPRQKMEATLERFASAEANNDHFLQKKWAREAIQIKRDAKKSWVILGVSDELSKRFIKLTAND